MGLSRRHGLFIGIGLLLIFFVVEIQSYAFGKLSIANGNSFQFYQADVFDLAPEQLTRKTTQAPLAGKATLRARSLPSSARLADPPSAIP